jgi:hypothetical protein
MKVIGEVFTLDGKRFIVKEDADTQEGCLGCYFEDKICSYHGLECREDHRPDDKCVHFEEVR